MVLHLTERDVRALITIDIVLEAVEESFRGLADGTAINLSRRRLMMPRGLLHLMSSAVGSRNVFGSKEYATFGGPVQFLIPLYDLSNGRLLALIESDWLGRLRTGAASGVATKYMARPDSLTLGVIGAGGQARTQMLAVCAALPGIDKVKVFSRSAAHRTAFAAEMQPQVKAEIVAVDSAREAVEGSDVLVTMTSAREPVFEGDWLPEGIHINAAGANSANRREIDNKTVRQCSRIAVDSLEQAKLECGDLIHAVEAGILYWEDVVEFTDIVAGRVPGRTAPEERTLFESQGISVWDIATAARVYELAQAQGVGRPLALFEEES